MNPTKLIRSIFAKRLSQIDRYADYGDIIQQKTLLDLLQKAKNTEFGTKFKFNDISSYKSFAENIPINGYEELKPYIERTMSGEQNILWPTPIRHFAKSSGTTNDKSKFIPVSAESLRYCHYQGGSDCVALYLRENPQSRFFSGKGLILGGSRAQNPFGKAYCGDLSAILIQNINPLINLISAHERMGHQARSHRREHDRSRYHQSVGSTLVVSSPHQTHLKKNRSAEPHGSMAQPRSFFPRRNQFRTLSRTIPGAHLQPQHALRRDL